MKFQLRVALAATLVSVAALASASVSAQALKVGAAKVDVTPAAKDLPKTMLGVLDPLHVRAIVIDDGKTRAALVTVDAGAIGTDTWEKVSARAARELRIPASQLLLTATHTHSAPWMRGEAYEAQIFSAIRKAAAAVQPARMAYGTGVSYINVNRNIIDRETNRWWEGPNYEGVSDKTVAVMRFETLAGAPIALYYNYGVHAVLTGNLDLVSADLPGAASNYIEDSLGNDVVAVYSNGAAGDQNPIYFQQTYDLRAIRTTDYAKRGEDISNAMPPGGTGMDRKNPQVAKLMAQQKQMILSMGQFLGEEVMHVMRGTERLESSIQVDGRFKTVSCPGRERTNQGRAGFPGEYKEAGPVDIRLGLLQLGDIMIGAVNAEVFNPIAQRLKKESPHARTMMATLTNGSARSGYIPHDAGFGMYTFEVLSSRLQPGCAESAIVNGILDLMAQPGK